VQRVMFVVTTSTNMGDIALCQEWIADIGREDTRYAFVISPDLAPFIDPSDACYRFSREIHVKHTILEAAASFHPDAVIFATNSFWNMPGQEGAEYGRFALEPDDIEVPVLSFDPLEIGFVHKMPQSGNTVSFEPVPGWVGALRYMSRSSPEPNALHYRSTKVFDAVRSADREAALVELGLGLDQDRPTVLFPISRDRFAFIEQHYPRYYPHLARLLSAPSCLQAQFVVVAPDTIAAFQELPNVVQIGPQPFDRFLALIAASSLYLTDSLISCMVDAIHMEVPTLLLANTGESSSESRDSFLGDAFFSYRVFPYGMSEICRTLISRFEIQDCFTEVEVLDPQAFADAVAALLFGTLGPQISEGCRRWKGARRNLPSPKDTLQSVLS
jgi:hypothetical protein